MPEASLYRMNVRVCLPRIVPVGLTTVIGAPQVSAFEIWKGYYQYACFLPIFSPPLTQCRTVRPTFDKLVVTIDQTVGVVYVSAPLPYFPNPTPIQHPEKAPPRPFHELHRLP